MLTPLSPQHTLRLKLNLSNRIKVRLNTESYQAYWPWKNIYCDGML